MENATAVQQAESQGTQDFSAPVKHNTDFSLGIFGSSDNFLMATQMAYRFCLFFPRTEARYRTSLIC